MQINKDNVTFGNSVTVSTTTIEKRLPNPNHFVRNGTTSLTLNNLRITDTEIVSRNSRTSISNTFAEVNTVAVYGASGSFTVPAGVYAVVILAAGGGAGGQGARRITTNSKADYASGAKGGPAGAGIMTLLVTPGSTISFTVGAGGNGGVYSGGLGGSGGTTTVTYGGNNVLVATGGVNNGTGGTTTASYKFDSASIYNITSVESVDRMEIEFVDGSSIDTTYIDGRAILQTVAGTAAQAYSYAGAYKMGAPGAGGPPNTSSGRGAVGGGVMIFYKV